MKAFKTILAISFFINSTFTFSQNETGDIETYLTSIISSLPSSSGNQYTPPSVNELNSWNSIISNILNKNIIDARLSADSLNYEIINYTDSTLTPIGSFYILREKAAQQNYYGTYIFNQNPCRKDVVLQAPHPKYDTNTGFEAVFCFKRLSPLALFFSGTHRCNHSSYSTCSGTTSSCNGTSQNFRISDMAHNTLTMFQKTTEVISAFNTNSVFIQLHGFGKKSTDPYVILSNGTRQTPTTDYAVQLKNQLASIDNALTFKIAHIDLSWNRLIAFTNTQGRFLNGMLTPCDSFASSTSGRFIHIEQEKTKLRQDSIGWFKMKNALANVFECKYEIDSTLNISPNFDNLIIRPNPTYGRFSVICKNIKNIRVIDMRGVTHISKNYNYVSTISLDLNHLHKGIYFVRILTNKKSITRKIVLQ